MHFSVIPRAREDRPLWLKQWIESLLAGGIWNIIGTQSSVLARVLHAKGKLFNHGKWVVTWNSCIVLSGL